MRANFRWMLPEEDSAREFEEPRRGSPVPRAMRSSARLPLCLLVSSLWLAPSWGQPAALERRTWRVEGVEREALVPPGGVSLPLGALDALERIASALQERADSEGVKPGAP